MVKQSIFSSHVSLDHSSTLLDMLVFYDKFLHIVSFVLECQGGWSDYCSLRMCV